MTKCPECGQEINYPPNTLQSGSYAGVPIDELPDRYLIGMVCWWLPKDHPLYNDFQEEALDRINEGIIKEPASDWILGKEKSIELNQKQRDALLLISESPRFSCGAAQGMTFKSLRNRGLAHSNRLGQTEITTRGKEWLKENVL
jgi:hypothetical protein